MAEPVEAVFLDDLDALWNRTAGAKWTRYGPDVVAAWVAEVDVEPAPHVTAAISEAVATGGLGYPVDDLPDRLAGAFVSHSTRRHGWTPDADGVRTLTDVVQGIALAISAFSAVGDGAATLLPSYPPVLSQIEALGRRVVPHVLERGEGWALDAGSLDSSWGRDVSMIVLVNPHNPTGRSFRRDELEAIGALAVERDLVVVADEIHQDLVWDGSHVPMATISPEVAARTLTLTSAAKSHGLAGLRCAVAHLGEALVERFDAQPAVFRGGPSSVSMAATVAAWSSDGSWEASLAAQLVDRRDQALAFLDEHLPEVLVARPEATFLAWLDVSALGLGDEPADFFLDRARVALGRGLDFGEPGRGHVRLNFATGPTVLEEILERLVTAVDLRGC